MWSQALFNVYMNNLSVTLNQSGIGGSLGDSLVNHTIPVLFVTLYIYIL